MFTVRNQSEYDYISNNKIGGIFYIGQLQYRIKEKNSGSDFLNQRIILEEIDTGNFFKVNRTYSNKANRYEFYVQKVKPATKIIWKKI